MNAPDAIARLNAALEGRYHIERELGEGGMATVYLADDLKHERKVALKVLKPELGAVIGAERFLAEIKTTANLQHPHILPLFDSGEADGFLFYVMPYVEGETLRARIDREVQLGVDDALAMTRKVADALDYAHDNGVVHRDIKPGNILLSQRGEPLVADFGIALAVAHAGGGRITETGLSLGTPHYMSPEQATGDRGVDARSDLYALGCVLYEMLAGEPPFSASNVQAILAKILTVDAPSITLVRRTVPAHVSAAIAKALEKLPADRFASVVEFVAALGDESFTYQARVRTTAASAQSDASITDQPAPWHRDRRVVLALAFATLASVLGAWGWLRPAPEPVPGVTTRMEVTGNDAFSDLAISPDGRSIAVRRRGGVGTSVLVRAADDPTWRELLNATGGRDMSFSPDGESVAFSLPTGVFKVPVSGGPALPISEVSGGGAIHWASNDTIVFANGGPLFRVGSSGGEPEVLLDSDTIEAHFPHLLPGGRAVVFSTRPRGDALQARVLLLEIETGVVRELAPSGTNPKYLRTGHIVYGHGNQFLMVVPFDLDRLQTTGPAVSALPSLSVYGRGRALYDVSVDGTLIYGSAPTGDPQSVDDPGLVWVGMNGTETYIPIDPVPEEAQAPRADPSGVRIAYQSDGQIWIFDTATETPTQLTFEGVNSTPIWSKDGRFVYFLSERAGTQGFDGFRKLVDGSQGAEQLWSAAEGEEGLTSISPDSRWLVVARRTPAENLRLSLVDLTADSVSFRPYRPGGPGEMEGAIHPNGRWMAYASSELAGGQGRSGAILIRGFPEPTGGWRVSRAGEEGSYEPVWAPSGDALYFTNGTSIVRAEVSADGASPVIGRVTELGIPWTYGAGNIGPHGIAFDIHPAGDRLLAVKGSTDGLETIFLVTDWFEELRERVGASN